MMQGDRRTDRQTDGQTDRQTDGWTDEFPLSVPDGQRNFPCKPLREFIAKYVHRPAFVFRKHVEYLGGFHPGHQIVRWLWDVICKDFTAEEKALFLKVYLLINESPVAYTVLFCAICFLVCDRMLQAACSRIRTLESTVCYSICGDQRRHGNSLCLSVLIITYLCIELMYFRMKETQ